MCRPQFTKSQRCNNNHHLLIWKIKFYEYFQDGFFSLYLIGHQWYIPKINWKIQRGIMPDMQNKLVTMGGWCDCMMMWLMTCSTWLQFIEKGQFSLNFTKAWQTDQLTDWPSYRDAGMHPKICSGLFMAFPGFQLLKKNRFSLFFTKASPTDGRTDGPTDGQTRL